MRTRFPSGPAIAGVLIVLGCRSAGTSTSAAPVTQAAPAVQQLVMDSAVRTGTLPNGLTYYVRRNAWPLQRAELRLVVDAGSILEDEDQRGLAHFLEHMAFNGTEHFPKQKLVGYLESLGMGFGPDINASTSFDETIYSLTIPTDSAKFLETALQVLQDWAEHVTIDSAEVARERGVIIEEWRSRRSVEMRLFEQQDSIQYAGARYADRTPIGLPAVIETATVEQLRRFYDRWYRPDLMAVVVVGDIDAAATEELVREKFSGMKARITPAPPRTEFAIPDQVEPAVSVVSDPELTESTVTVLYRHPVSRTLTAADFRRDLALGLYLKMLNARLGEIALQSNPPFISASSGPSTLGRATTAYALQATVKNGGLERGLQALLTEIARVRTHGFTNTELERQKAILSQAYENAHEGRERVPSQQYAGAYAVSFLGDEPVLDIAQGAALARDVIPAITLDEVNHFATELVTPANQVILASQPKKASSYSTTFLRVPDVKALLAAYQAGLQAQVEPYAEQVAQGPLLDSLPPAGRVVREMRDSATGTVDWTLSNGIRVLVKQTDFTPNLVSIHGFRPGGRSLAPDSLVVPAAMSAQLVDLGGVGRYDRVSLQKRLAGKTVHAETDIEMYKETAAANASPRDLETALQLLYLKFTAPRLDSSMYRVVLDRLRTSVANRAADPNAQLGDSLTLTMSRYHPRVRALIPSTAMIQQMDLTKSLDFYSERFADAGGFIFAIVGILPPDSLKPLVERYLGSLPTATATHAYRDLGIEPPNGVVRKSVYLGEEPTGLSGLTFHGATEFTYEKMARHSAVQEVLQLRVLEALRRRLSGTYSPRVSGSFTDEPTPQYRVTITFGANPSRLSELQQALFEELARLRAEGPTEEELQKVKERARREFETGIRSNRTWLSSLLFLAKHGRPLADILSSNRYTQSLTRTQVRDAAREFLDMNSYVLISKYPASATP